MYEDCTEIKGTERVGGVGTSPLLRWQHCRFQHTRTPIFHLFLHLKKHVACQKFHEEERNEDTACLRAQVAELVTSEYKNWYPG